MSLQRQHFLLRHLGILVRPGFEPAIPHSTDQRSPKRSPNQANQVAVGSQEPHEVPSCIPQDYLRTPFNFAGIGTVLE